VLFSNWVIFLARHNELRSKDLILDIAMISRTFLRRTTQSNDGANMTQNRFAEQTSEQSAPFSSAGFLVIPVPTADSCPASPLQLVYQQLYSQAVQTNQRRPSMRELFTIMN
jgi:hypothetical protein